MRPETKLLLNHLFSRSAAFAAAGVLTLIAAACHTTNNPATAEGSAEGTAAVQLRGNTPGQITEVATEVFQAHGYVRGGRRSAGLVFEKRGGKFTNLAYGSWGGDTPVWTRVKLAIIATGEGEYTLQCKAYHVLDRGSSTEEELKIGRMGSGPYHKLLDEIAARFRGSGKTATGPPAE